MFGKKSNTVRDKATPDNDDAAGPSDAPHDRSDEELHLHLDTGFDTDPDTGLDLDGSL